MSRLEELIRQLCPDGVEYKSLQQCTKAVENIKWSLTSKEYQYIDLSSVDRETNRITGTQTITADNAPSRAQQVVRANDILLGTTRPMLKRYCMIDDNYDGQICSTGFCVLRANERTLPGWIYHQITSTDFFAYVEKNQKGASYPSISDTIVKAYRIPLPPLEVQQEIVRILDHFTELTAELTAELTKRDKQHQYYAQYLYNAIKEMGAPVVHIKDVCDLLTGFPFDSSQFVKEGVQLLRGINIKRGFLDYSEGNNRYWRSIKDYEKFLLSADDIVIAMDGSLVGKSYGQVKDQHLPALLVQRVTRVRATKVNPHYLYHYISSGAFTNYVKLKKTSGAVPHISMKDIENFVLPLPTEKIQDEIAKILDRFDALCNDLTSGLPAEIEARQKQYEYYRDKLLTFKKKTS